MRKVSYFLIIFFSQILIIDSQTCSWTSWTEWSTCSDTCGNCGTQSRTRACIDATPTCSCSGENSDQRTCAPAICRYPRVSCCIGAPASVNGRFECA